MKTMPSGHNIDYCHDFETLSYPYNPLPETVYDKTAIAPSI